MHAARYLIQLALAVAMPLALQRWDARRLTPEQRARAWNFASWASALYGFNIFSMLGWCWVTRQSFRGAMLGVVTTLLLLVLLTVLDFEVARALGIQEPPFWELG